MAFLSADQHTRLTKFLDGKVVLVTGGTGSFGQKFIKVLLTNYTTRSGCPPYVSALALLTFVA